MKSYTSHVLISHPFFIVQTEPPSHGLVDAMSLLNVKSEEIKKLQAALDHERHTNASLTSTTKDLQSALASAQILASKPNADTAALAELQVQREQEQASWGAERASFVASLDSLTRSKASADADRDFFRDQYTQASGYVNTVRAENVDLEQRALVAEGKAKDGVGMIKAMFEGQVKTLQADLAQWKGIAELLQEKDKRTGDEIRRKAAEEPELRAKYVESRREIERLEGTVFELSRERNVLKLKLSNFGDLLERTNDGTHETAQMSNSADAAYDDELVYRCLWRPGRGSEPCLSIFASSEVCLYTGLWCRNR
jgi:chromosome segregation ATPase